MSEPANPYLVELATAEDDEGYASSGYAESSIDVGTQMLSDDSDDERVFGDGLAHTDAALGRMLSTGNREQLYNVFKKKLLNITAFDLYDQKKHYVFAKSYPGLYMMETNGETSPFQYADDNRPLYLVWQIVVSAYDTNKTFVQVVAQKKYPQEGEYVLFTFKMDFSGNPAVDGLYRLNRRTEYFDFMMAPQNFVAAGHGPRTFYYATFKGWQAGINRVTKPYYAPNKTDGQINQNDPNNRFIGKETKLDQNVKQMMDQMRPFNLRTEKAQMDEALKTPKKIIKGGAGAAAPAPAAPAPAPPRAAAPPPAAKPPAAQPQQPVPPPAPQPVPAPAMPRMWPGPGMPAVRPVQQPVMPVVQPWPMQPRMMPMLRQ